MGFKKSISGLCWALLYIAMPNGGFAQIASKEGSLRPIRELKGIEVEDRIGSRVPLEVELTNQDGQQVRLKDYIRPEQAHPVIITLGYYACPMLCNLVLNGLLEGLKGLSSLQLGKDFSIVSVSIDPLESVELAFQKRQTYISALGASGAPSWTFHVAKEAQVRRLADALGFRYKKNPKTGEYMHGAAIFVVSPKGILTRTLYGIHYPSSDLKLALLESADGKLASVVDRILLSCFHYDPDSRRYGLYVIGVMRLGGGLMVVLMLLLIGRFWMRELWVWRWKT